MKTTTIPANNSRLVTLLKRVENVLMPDFAKTPEPKMSESEMRMVYQQLTRRDTP